MIMVVEKGHSMRIPPDGARGPAAAKICLRDSCCYEFKIPIHKDENRSYAIGSALGETIGVGIAWSDPEKERMKPPPGGMRGGGGTSGLPIGKRTGPMRGISIEEREMWFRVILAEETQERKYQE